VVAREVSGAGGLPLISWFLVGLGLEGPGVRIVVGPLGG
jgi:hypothetical protein